MIFLCCAEAINKDVPAPKVSTEANAGAAPTDHSPLGQSAGDGDVAPNSAAAPSVLDGQVGTKEDSAQPHANDAESLGDSLSRSIISFFLLSYAFELLYH